MRDFRNLVGGRTSGSGKVEVRSPYYNLGFTIPEGDEGELKAALAAALASREAIDALSTDERAGIIRGALGRLELGEEHLQTARMTGYPVRQIRRSWDRFREGFLEFMKRSGPSEARARPLGFLLLPDNVDVIAPWAIFSAVYAGCPLVVKAGSLFPWVPVTVFKALAEAGYPEGGVNILFFRGTTAPYLARRAMREVLGREGTFVGFGRDSTLRAILGDDGALAAEALLKGRFIFFGSGKSQGVVCKDADQQVALASIIDSLLLPPFSCLNPKVLYLEADIGGEFVPRLVDAVRGLKVGDPLDDGTDIGYVDEGAIEEVERVVRYSEGFGALRLLGRRLGKNQAEPYLVQGIPEDFNPLEREDYPVPILGLVEGSAEEIVRRSNAAGKALVTSIFTKEIRPTFREVRTYHLHLNRGTRTTMLTGHQGVDLWRAFLEEVRRG